MDSPDLWQCFEAGSVFGFSIAGMISLVCVLFHDYLSFRKSGIES